MQQQYRQAKISPDLAIIHDWNVSFDIQITLQKVFDIQISHNFILVTLKELEKIIKGG